MTPPLSRGRLAIFYLTAIGAMTIAASAVDVWPTRLVYNASASVPLGWYSVAPVDRLIPGDLVIVRPPLRVQALLAERGYLGAGVPFVKHVAAEKGATVCRHDDSITIDGAIVGQAREADSLGRPLPRWTGCRLLGANHVFLFNQTAPGSFDGRYLGPTPVRDIIGKARPLWTW